MNIFFAFVMSSLLYEYQSTSTEYVYLHRCATWMHGPSCERGCNIQSYNKETCRFAECYNDVKRRQNAVCVGTKRPHLAQYVRPLHMG